jgi:NAD(P)-dependent dehydrogenase (short-subunit alcohol dehydrogenase family)
MNEVIIVTGGAGGIGSDLCRGLASDGLKVIIADYAKFIGQAEKRRRSRSMSAIRRASLP